MMDRIKPNVNVEGAVVGEISQEVCSFRDRQGNHFFNRRRDCTSRALTSHDIRNTVGPPGPYRCRATKGNDTDRINPFAREESAVIFNKILTSARRRFDANVDLIIGYFEVVFPTPERAHLPHIAPIRYKTRNLHIGVAFVT